MKHFYELFNVEKEQQAFEIFCFNISADLIYKKMKQTENVISLTANTLCILFKNNVPYLTSENAYEMTIID